MADFIDRVILDVSDAEAGWQMLSAALQGYTVNQQSQIMSMAAAQAGFDQLESKLIEVIRTMDEVADNTKRAADSLDAAGQAAGSNANQVGIAVNAYGMLREAMMKVAEFTKEAIVAAVDQEKADLLLMNALRQAGDAAYYFTEQYRDQAKAIQETTGYRQEEIERMQALLIQLGVAPDKLDAVTQATLDLSAATGQDLFQTALMLGKAEEGVVTALQRHGIVLNDTTDKTQLLDEATAKIEERFGGSAKAAYQGSVKDVGDLGNSFHNLTKSIGEAIIETEEETGEIETLATAFQFWSNLISGADEKHERAVIDHQLEITETINLVDRHRRTLAELQIQQMDGAKGLEDKIAREEKAVQQLQEKLDQLQGKTIKFPGAAVDDPKADAALDKQYEHAQDEHQKYIDHEAELHAQEEEKFKKHWDHMLEEFEHYQDKVDVENQTSDAKHARDHENFLYKLRETENQISEKALADQAKAAKKLAQQEEAELKTVLRDVKQLGDQLLEFAVGSFTKSLTVNQQYTDQYNALSDKRTQADLASQGIQKSLSQVTKERQSEEKANREAELADILANIAQQAAIKALFEAAEATADLFFNQPKAAMEFAAAGMYAGVAVAAGGAAAAITSSRGMTTEEASSLQGMQQQTNTKGATDVSGQTTGSSTDAKQSANTIVNVYQLGIAGATQAQQAQELAKIQKQYDQRRMGK